MATRKRHRGREWTIEWLPKGGGRRWEIGGVDRSYGRGRFHAWAALDSRWKHSFETLDEAVNAVADFAGIPRGDRILVRDITTAESV